MARKKSQQQQILMRALGIPEDACSTVNTQWQRVLRELAATEARIRERSPHLSAAQRLELAADLVRARGLIPLAERREH